MNAVTYRDVCGSARGAAAHQAGGERQCGWCAEAEMLARLRAESAPSRPSKPGAEWLTPVTAEQARANAAALAAEIGDTEWEPSASRQLRVVKGAA